MDQDYTEELSREGQLAVEMIVTLVRRFGMETTLQLTEYARRIMYPPSPLPNEYPIDPLELSIRTANCLRRHSIATVGEVRAKYEQDRRWFLKYVKGLGTRSDNDIREAIGLHR